ncbi:hypothetical protein BDW74DRAFT_172145 [Aspergillus multicolor]|uniref:ESCRT-II subunit protein VPS25 n=1 Tax=Aspergillus multicolor TaxID=41759 RepID=UPI003CCDFC7C
METALGQQPAPFPFPARYSFPPFFSIQPNDATRGVQFKEWSSIIQSWCRHHRIYKLNLVEAIESQLFRNTTIKKQLSLNDARAVLEWMSKPEEERGGGRRAELVDTNSKTAAWIWWVWWRRPEEWAEIIGDWIDRTGQKNVVLTFYELLEGEATVSQEWHGMDPEVMMKSLNVLVKQGKAQIFGNEGQEGIKFF